MTSESVPRAGASGGAYPSGQAAPDPHSQPGAKLDINSAQVDAADVAARNRRGEGSRDSAPPGAERATTRASTTCWACRV